MNLDNIIDRFVFDVGIVDKFEYFIPALYDHILISMHNSITRCYRYEYYIDLINIIQNNPIAFIRRYEAKNDILFNIEDAEIIEIISSMESNPSTEKINAKINEFRAWKIKQDLKALVTSLKLDFNDTLKEAFPQMAGFLQEISSENNS